MKKLSKIEIFLELMSLVGMVLIFIVAIRTWINGPDIIPIHFNSAGAVDGYGSKGSVFIMPIILIVLYLMLTVLTKYPEVYNYAVKITESNREKQYKMATMLMRILKLELIVMFTYIEITTWMIIKNGYGKLPGVFTILTMIILFGTIGIYIYKSSKIK